MPLTRNVRTLRVVANPFAALHHISEEEVRCSGAFPHEPPPPGSGILEDAVRHVGARRVVAMIDKGDPKVGKEASYDRAFEFTHEPVTVNRSEYYRRALITGPIDQRGLFPADEETHKWAGLPGKFVDPMSIIAQKSMELGDLLPAHFGELVPEQPEIDASSDGEKPAEKLEAAEPKWKALLAPHKEKHAEKLSIAMEETKAMRAKEQAEREAKKAAQATAGHAQAAESDDHNHHDA